MKKLIVIILFSLVSMLATCQFAVRSYAFYTPLSSSTTGAESIWLMNNNGDDEKENNDISLYGSAFWTNVASNVLEGTYALDANCSNCGASVPSIDYGNEFTIVGNTKKWGLISDIALYSAYQSIDGFEVGCVLGTPALTFKTGNGTSTQTATSSTISITTGIYFSWAVVVDRTDGTVDFYIDGSFVSSGTTRTDFETTTTASIGIGLDDLGDSWARHDAYHIYKWKLTADDIEDIHDDPGTEVFDSSVPPSPSTLTFDNTEITFDNTSITWDATTE